MIRTIREKLSILMWFVVAAFVATIIFSWGMGGITKKDPRSEGIIAKINGQEVKYAELKNIEESYIKNQDQKDLTGVKSAELKKKAWHDFVKMIVIRQELEKQDITVSKDQLYDEILNNPLPELRNSEQFQTDGVFDTAKYQEFIKNPNPQYEDFYKAIQSAYEGRIPGSILEKRVGNSAYLSEFEIMNMYREENVKVKVKYLKAETNSFMPADSMITDEEIENYFKQHPYEFPKQNEQRSFDYVLFSTAPTEADSALALEDINYALKRIQNGIPFEEVARNYSEDTSASNGGDLGFFGKGKMLPEFEKAAFEAEPGEIVGPVKTKYGYHIIKVASKKTENDEVTEVQASHILVKFKTYPSTLEEAQYAAINFRDEIYKNGNDSKAFNTAAEKLGYKVLESTFVPETDRLNDLGMIPGLSDFLFKNDVGAISPFMYSDQGYIYLKVKEIKPEREKTLDEVKKTIIYKLRQQHGLEKAYEKLVELKTAVTDTLSMNSIAEKEGFKTGTSNKFSVDVYVDNVGVDRLMYEKAIATDIGKLSDPFRGGQGAYIIYVLEKDEFDQEKFNNEKTAFRDKHEKYIQRQMIQEWLDGLVKKADVVDMRYLYYR